jgi:hypothetical protein
MSAGSLKTKGGMGFTCSLAKFQSCAKSGTVAQLSGEWHNLRGAIGCHAKDTKVAKKSKVLPFAVFVSFAR